MKISNKELGRLIIEMRKVYFSGGNAMEYARTFFKNESSYNEKVATLIAYDLQAGNYVNYAKKNPEQRKNWGLQIAEILNKELYENSSLLEIGVGEATTLSSITKYLPENIDVSGFDISWSRIRVAKDWLKSQNIDAKLFVGDLFNIPLADDSIDVVYSSHSLEPNGGYEKEAITEALRVCRKSLILIEPIYELASEDAKKRMKHHGYVRDLKKVAQSLGAKVVEYRLLEHTANSLNPSGVIRIHKNGYEPSLYQDSDKFEYDWSCPLTQTPLTEQSLVFNSKDCGIIYPIIDNIPLLKPENAIIASKY